MQPAPKPVQPGEFFNAVRASNFELMQELIARGANVDERDNVGNTPLILVAGRTGYPVKFVQLLLASGARVDEQNNNGNTALILACSVNNYAVVKLLLDKGAALEKRNKPGFTAEAIAQKQEYTQILQLIAQAVETRRKAAAEKAKIDAAHDMARKSQDQLREKSRQRHRPPSL